MNHCNNTSALSLTMKILSAAGVWHFHAKTGSIIFVSLLCAGCDLFYTGPRRVASLVGSKSQFRFLDSLQARTSFLQEDELKTGRNVTLLSSCFAKHVGSAQTVSGCVFSIATKT